MLAEPRIRVKARHKCILENFISMGPLGKNVKCDIHLVLDPNSHGNCFYRKDLERFYL
jgi:hypothetical protein